MAAIMPQGGGGGRGGVNQSGNPYEHYDAPTVEDDLIDPDDGGYNALAMSRHTQS